MKLLPFILLIVTSPILSQDIDWTSSRYDIQNALSEGEWDIAETVMVDVKTLINEHSSPIDRCEYHLTYASYLDGVGELIKAEEEYTKGIEIATGRSDCKVCLAKSLVNRSNLTNSIRKPIYSTVLDLQTAIKLCEEEKDDCHYYALLSLAQWYYYHGSADSSILWCSKLLEKANYEHNEPWIGEALYNRALSELYSEQLYECIKDCESALPYLEEHSTSSLPYLFVTHGSAHRRLKQYEAATKKLLMADSLLSEYDPELQADIWEELSMSYARLGDTLNEARYASYVNTVRGAQQARQDSVQQALLNKQQGRMNHKVTKAEKAAAAAMAERKSIIRWSVMGSIALGALTFYLIFRVRKQRKLRKQEREEAMGRLNRTRKELTEEKLMALQEARRKERNRIARDLHDSVGGQIAAVKLQSEVLRMSDDPMVIVNMVNQLDKLAHEVRSISHDLNSSLIEELGLEAALIDMAEQFSKSGKLSIDLQILCDDCSLTIEQESHLYRMIVEAANNALRHGKATRLLIELDRDEADILQVIVSDNGTGFDTSSEYDGMGLRTMKYRAAQIGAQVDISSQSGEGTTVAIRMPHIHEPI